MIRRALVGDEEIIHSIYIDSFSNEWSVAEIRESLSRDYAVFLLSCSDDTDDYTGFICYYTSGDIIYIGIKPSYRRRGIGLELLNKAVELATAQDTDYLYLEVRKSNTSAMALYDRAGFTMIAERSCYYEDNEPALIYKLELK